MAVAARSRAVQGFVPATALAEANEHAGDLSDVHPAAACVLARANLAETARLKAILERRIVFLLLTHFSFSLPVRPAPQGAITSRIFSKPRVNHRDRDCWVQ